MLLKVFMPTLAIVTDWGFDPVYSAKTRDKLENSLSAMLGEWVMNTYPKLAEFLTQHAEQQSTLAIHCAGTGLKVKGAAVWLLLILIAEPSGPSQCVFFIGPQDFIERKKAGLQTQLNAQLQASGVRAAMAEGSG
jgi:hypothetical protein